MIKSRLSILLLLFAPLCLFAQQAEEDVDQALVFGAYGHTFGVGLNVDYWKAGWGINDFIFGLDFATYKYRREQKIESFYASQEGKDYFPDKKNYFFNITPSVGLSREIISRSPHNRIPIRLGAVAGINLGLLKPYYIEEVVPIPGRPDEGITVDAAYDPAQHTFTNIYGEGGFFLGINEMKFRPGLHLEANGSLDFSRTRNYIRAIELGIFTDGYLKEIEILGEGTNKQLFLGFKLGFLMGNAWDD